MSLFKALDWWSVNVGASEKLGFGCLCLADIVNEGFHEIIVCDYDGCLRIFSPCSTIANGGSVGYKADDLLCEIQLKAPVLQIEAGNFTSGAAVHLAVLHPRKLSVFLLTVMGGAVSHGFQYELVLKYGHLLQKSAYNFCYGSFGKVKGRDLICVQSLDGTLSFFDENNFLFSHVLSDAILPGPIEYLPVTDSILTVSSNHLLECYRFQVLTASARSQSWTEANSTGKRVSCDWAVNLSEAALQINLVTSAKNTEIAVLGERSIFFVSHDGKLRTVLKLEYSPTCFAPFSTNADGSDSLLIVGTNTKTLMVHQNTRLAWSAQLLHVPWQVKVANFRTLKGLIVTVGDDGVLMCTYLGSAPEDLAASSSLRTLKNNAHFKSELEDLTKEISQLENGQDFSFMNANKVEEIEISVEVPSALDFPPKSYASKAADSERIPSITVTVRLKLKAGVGSLQNLSLLIVVQPPLKAEKSAHSIPLLDEDGFSCTSTCFMKCRMLPVSLDLTCVATYFNALGNPRVVTSSVVLLPLTLVAKACKPSKAASNNVTIEINKPAVSLEKLFSDLLGDSHQKNMLGFRYYGLDPVITVLMDKSQHCYHLQCLDYPYIWHIVNELLRRLSKFYEVSASTSECLLPIYKGPLPINEYFEVIDRHFECCQKSKVLKEELESHTTQFHKIQVKLLTSMKDFASNRINRLENLLEATYTDIMATIDNLDRNTWMLTKVSANLSCASHLFLLALKSLKDYKPQDWLRIASAFSLSVDPYDSQGWEEKTLLAVASLNEAMRFNNAVPSHKPCDDVQFTLGALKQSISDLCNLLNTSAQSLDHASSSRRAENEKLPKSLRNHNQELGTSFVEVNEGEEIVVTVDIEPGSAPVKIKELGETMLKQCAGLTGETPTARTGNFSKCVGRQETVDRPKGNSRATSSDANIADEQLLTICKQLSNVKPPEKRCDKRTSGLKPSSQEVPDLDLLITTEQSE